MGSTDEPNRFQHTRVLGVDDVVANTGEGGVAAMGRGGEMVDFTASFFRPRTWSLTQRSTSGPLLLEPKITAELPCYTPAGLYKLKNEETIGLFNECCSVQQQEA